MCNRSNDDIDRSRIYRIDITDHVIYDEEEVLRYN